MQVSDWMLSLGSLVAYIPPKETTVSQGNRRNYSPVRHTAGWMASHVKGTAEQQARYFGSGRWRWWWRWKQPENRLSLIAIRHQHVVIAGDRGSTRPLGERSLVNWSDYVFRCVRIDEKTGAVPPWRQQHVGERDLAIAHQHVFPNTFTWIVILRAQILKKKPHSAIGISRFHIIYVKQIRFCWPLATTNWVRTMDRIRWWARPFISYN